MPLSQPTRNRIALAVLICDLALLAFAVGSQLEDAAVLTGLAFTAVVVALVVGLAIIGRLIIDRSSGNAVGWIFLASSVGMSISTAGYSWAGLSHDRFHNTLPATVFAAWLQSWVAIPSLVLLVIFVPLLFPDGRLPSPRWRPVAGFAVLGIVATSLGSALVAAPLDPTGIPNPLGIALPPSVVDLLGLVDSLSGLIVFSFAIAAIVVRYRRGSPVERLQLRWFVFPATVAIACLGIGSTLFTAGPVGSIVWITGIAALATVPIAIAIAILRHRLYDIDVIINRTAVYASVSAVLATAFVLGNVALQSVVESATHQRSELLTGALGVGIGLLFGPVRRRIRPLVDHLLPSRAMLALLFTDIVGSTQMIVSIGDERWRTLLGRYLGVVREELARYGGHEVNTAGDAFFATFLRPVDAVRAASSIRAAVAAIGLETRTGLHLGEVEMRGEQVSGLAVHTAARVMAAAGDGEILVSDAMRDAIADSAVPVRERGRHELKGVPGDWELFAVEASA